MPPEIQAPQNNRRVKLDTTISVTEILKAGAILVAVTLYVVQGRGETKFAKELAESQHQIIVERVVNLENKQKKYDQDITDIKMALTMIATKMGINLTFQSSQ